LPVAQAQKQRPVNAEIFHTLAELASDIAQKQKPIDAARQQSEYDIKVDDLKNSLAAEADPNTWRDKFMQQEQVIRKDMLGQITDGDVQKALIIHADRQYGNNVRNVTEAQIKASHAKQLGDIESVGATLQIQAAQTDDPQVRASAINTYRSLISTAAQTTTVGGRPVPASITPKAAEDR
jgi:hypothetical protein